MSTLESEEANMIRKLIKGEDGKADNMKKDNENRKQKETIEEEKKYRNRGGYNNCKRFC